MFHRLHRIVIWGFWSLVVTGLWFLYCHRAAMQPLVTRLQALEHVRIEPGSPGTLAELTGRVFSITGPDSFWVRDDDGTAYHLRLAGVQGAVVARRGRGAATLWHQGMTNLADLILSNRVRIDLTYTNVYRLGLGVVHLGATNVNCQVVAAGWARINAQQLRTLSVKDQYELFRAQQAAKAQRLGIWH
jgi:endonuclease YncB( thermonuclease family)